ncbi:MAG: hypothetical protein LVQ95_02295 [Candidatus Micrarchaeales archaeon]|nr:hypothetical protein [Candidatus Micrarchaeales archaeon]
MTANIFDYLQVNDFTISTTVSGGTSPYTYNFIAYYAANDTPYDNEHATQSTNSFLDSFSSSAAPGNYVYGVTVTDSATTNEITSSSYTSNILIAPDPAITITPSNNPIDAGQTEIYTFTVTNGVGPFTIELYNITGGHQQGSNVIISAPGGSNTISFPASTTGTFSYNAIVTDLGTSAPYVFNSATNTISINTALTAASTPLASATSLDIDQSMTVNSVLPTSGTSPYTYNWLVSVGGGPYGQATQCTTNSLANQAGGTLETCTINGGTLTAGTSYDFELMTTDSAGTPETATSPASSAITTNTQLTAPAQPQVSATKLDVDQTEDTNGIIPSTGTPSYGWQWWSSTNGLAYVQTNLCILTHQISGGTAGQVVTCVSPGGTFTAGDNYAFKLQAIDSANTPENAISVASPTIDVATQLTAASTPTVFAANTETNQDDAVYSYLPSTGTAPYSYLFLTSANGGSYAAAAQCFIDSGSGQAANALEVCSLPGSPRSLAPGNYIFKLQTTDSADAPETTNSATSPVITAKTPPSMTFTPSFPLIDAGQTETYTASVSNGFGPFTVELFNITSNAAVGSNVVISVPGGSNTLSFSAAGSGTFQYNAIATDLGTTNPYVFNSASNTLTVANTPAISIKTNKISLNAGGSVIFTTNIPSGEGVGPFAVNLVVGGSTIANTVIPSNGGNFTYTYTFNTLGTYTSEFQAVDEGTSVPFAFVSNSVTITVGQATGGGGGTGGSGGGGGGGPQAPSVQNTSNGYNVTGVAQLNTFNINLCGKAFKVTDNFITPNYTGVSIGTGSYNLYVDQPQLIAGTTSCYAKVTSISYLPILVTVNFLFYNTQLNGTNTIDIVGNPVHAEVTVTNSSIITLNVNNGNLLLSLLASISARENVTTGNLTGIPVPAPAGFRIARIIFINVTSNSTPKPSTHMHIIEKYNCTIPSSRLMPYLLLNGSWHAITPYSTNSSACTISYNITEDPVLALFELITPVSTTTVPSTSVATTSIATTSIPYRTPAPSAGYYTVLIIIAIALLVAAYELYRRRKGDIPRLKA